MWWRRCQQFRNWPIQPHARSQAEGGCPTLDYVVSRQRGLWWHDAHYLIEQVQAFGSRAWVWSDEAWSKVGEYFERMPTSVMQSNWHYYTEFDKRSTGRPRPLDYRQHETHLGFLDLNDHRYDQIPCGSTHLSDDNFGLLVDYCRAHVSPEHLRGFLMADWKTLEADTLDAHISTINVAAKVIAKNSPK